MDVFLRFMRGRDYPLASSCLKRWLEVFEGYDITLLSDNNSLIENHYFTDISHIKQWKKSNRELCPKEFSRYHYSRHTYSVLTAYTMARTDYFWLIDGDDTLFHHPIEWIRERLKRVEKIVQDYDGLSLDFYRHTDHIKQWSMGVALLKNIPIDIFYTVSKRDIVSLNTDQTTFNIDAIMDTLRKQKRLRLESFCFEDSYFTHMKALSYHWKDRKLWNIPLDEDIIVL